MAIIGSLPYTLTNGQTADATQVMADFTAIVNAVNSNAAAVASVLGDQYNYAADTGTVNNLIINPSTGAPSAYSDGTRMRTKAANTNTSSTVTVKFGSLATKSVVLDAAGTLPVVGSIIQNMHYVFEYDSTQDKCILVNPSPATGSYTGTMTGGATSPTGTILWATTADATLVTLTIPASFSATSNAATFTITGGPASIQPTQAFQGFPCYVTNSGANSTGCVSMASGSGTISLGNNNGYTTGNFTASGTKTFPVSGAMSFTYRRN